MSVEQWIANGGQVQQLPPAVNKEFAKYLRETERRYWKVRLRTGGGKRARANKASGIEPLTFK